MKSGLRRHEELQFQSSFAFFRRSPRPAIIGTRSPLLGPVAQELRTFFTRDRVVSMLIAHPSAVTLVLANSILGLLHAMGGSAGITLTPLLFPG